MTYDEKVKRLEEFKSLVLKWDAAWEKPKVRAKLRSQINQEKNWVRQEVIAARCFKSFTIGPPPIIGGLIVNGVDAFATLFDPPYDMSLTSNVVDMVEETIGCLQSSPNSETVTSEQPTIREEIVPRYAFIAMPMPSERPEFDDVHDAIKEAALRCGIQAERVDEPHSTERITDRILESIRRAEYVIADITEAKPNVYFEAGYAHALGKAPIYIARAGTIIEFDLKDYPVTFFKGLRELKDALEKKLRGLADAKKSVNSSV